MKEIAKEKTAISLRFSEPKTKKGNAMKEKWSLILKN